MAIDPCYDLPPNIMLQQPPSGLDLNAYFQRIGYQGSPTPTLETLQDIHRCHTQAIAFENLNSLLKQPVALDLPALQTKLVQQQRGGYCFEQNLLLRSVLFTLGFQVTNLAARVRWNLPPDVVTPRSHMLLRVDIAGQAYIADVGFGGITLTAPLLLQPDIPQTTPHESFRFTWMDDQYTLEVALGQAWKPLYYFDLQEQHLPDYEASNWFVSTHPQSLFTNFLIAARPDAHCRYALRDNQLTIHHLRGETEHQRLETVSEFRAVLEELFLIRLPAIAHLDTTLQQLIDRPTPP